MANGKPGRPRKILAVIQPITDTTRLLEYKLPCPELPETSIFNQPVFPCISKYHAYNFVPSQLKKAFDDFAALPGTLDFHCKQNHIRHDTVLNLLNVYPELRGYYEHAQERHTEVWARECEEIADDDSRDTTTVVKTNPKTGEITEYEQPNMVATRRDDLRVRTRTWLMERLSARYRPKTENHNLNLNINATLPAKRIDELFKTKSWID